MVLTELRELVVGATEEVFNEGTPEEVDPAEETLVTVPEPPESWNSGLKLGTLDESSISSA